MKTTDDPDDVELESRFGRAARLTFLASLGFWPLFLFAVKFLLDPPVKTVAAITERRILVYDAWLYPLIVIVAWLVAKHAMRRGRSEIVASLPWLLPALAAAYWLVYFLL